MPTTSHPQVRGYLDSDRHPLIDVLIRVRGTATDYPPRVDVKNGPDCLEHWLFDERPLHRFTAILNGDPVGHVLLQVPGTYLVTRYADLGLDPDVRWTEVGKLFADPIVSGRGIGSALLSHVREQLVTDEARLVLCVVETASAARDLYRREGLCVVGEFQGRHGRNIVMTD